jgi:membrane protease YdiL (CAAX protease family)
VTDAGDELFERPADAFPPDGEELPEPDPRRKCWRCGKRVDRGLDSCPYCRAPFGSRRRARSSPAARPVHEDLRPLKVVLWSFGLMLGVTIAYACYLHFGPGLPQGPRAEQERALLHEMLVVEAIDTALVVLAVVWAGAPKPTRPSGTSRVAAWAAGGPVLALLLGVNVLYGKLLQDYVGRQPHIEVIELNFKTHFWLVLLAVCVQPAVVEELFFRYLALGQLRRVMRDHGAVWVSAVMFGMAHLHNPIGMPVLILIGAGFGYMRLASGGLALPVLMHGFHNAIVVAMEGNG